MTVSIFRHQSGRPGLPGDIIFVIGGSTLLYGEAPALTSLW